MPYFLFLEFANPQVEAFLSGLRDAFRSEPASSPVHVTLRGPYKRAPRREQIDGFAERLRGYGVRIGDHGYFSTPRGFSVFLRAECVVFKEMWDKPDFPGPLESIEPHITIFETHDRHAAQEVRNFLRKTNIRIHTYNVYLRVYRSTRGADQPELFGPPEAEPSSPALRPVSRDVWWNIPAEVLDRARDLSVRLGTAPT